MHVKEEDTLLHWVSHWQEEAISLVGSPSWYLTRYCSSLHEYLESLVYKIKGVKCFIVWVRLN